MNEKITIETLTQNSVTIKRQNVTIVDGIEYPIGHIHSTAYVNSNKGRLLIQNELPESHVNAIFSMWGSVPTVMDLVQI